MQCLELRWFQTGYLCYLIYFLYQVVSGMNYNVTMEVGTSTCLKSAWKAGLTAQDCPLDANMGTVSDSFSKPEASRSPSG